MATLSRDIIKYTPIRTFLIYFIIAAFLIIAFKVPVAEMIPKKAAPVQVGTVAVEIQKPAGICEEGATKTQSCGLGPCASIQTTQCTNGRWVSNACPGNANARPEDCNGIDDDCDGYIDNNLNPPHCDLTLGVCAGQFYKRCEGWAWRMCADSDYDRWLYEPVERTCRDGYDNDCNGYTDSFDSNCKR